MPELLSSVSERATPMEIARFWPLDCLSAENLSLVSEHAEVCRHRAGSLVLSAGSDDSFSWYLGSGSVGLRSGDNRGTVVDSASDLGRFPLSNLRPHRYSVAALSPVTLFRIDKSVLGRVVNRDDTPLHHGALPLPPGSLKMTPCAPVSAATSRRV